MDSDQAARIWHEYLANIRNSNTFSSLLKYISEMSNKNQPNVSSNSSTSVLSSSSPSSSSSCSSHSQFNSYTELQAKVENIKRSNLNNCESMSDCDEDDDEDLGMYDDLGFQLKSSKTSTPCSTNCSPSLSISSLMSTTAQDVKQEKGLIKFSIENILGGGCSVVKTEAEVADTCFKSSKRMKYEPHSEDEIDFVKRSKFSD